MRKWNIEKNTIAIRYNFTNITIMLIVIIEIVFYKLFINNFM